MKLIVIFPSSIILGVIVVIGYSVAIYDGEILTLLRSSLHTSWSGNPIFGGIDTMKIFLAASFSMSSWHYLRYCALIVSPLMAALPSDAVVSMSICKSYLNVLNCLLVWYTWMHRLKLCCAPRWWGHKLMFYIQSLLLDSSCWRNPGFKHLNPFEYSHFLIS